MILNDVKDFYKSTYRFHQQTGMHPTNWSNWLARGYIPIQSQMKIEKLTKGKLKASLEDCKSE